MRMVTEPSTRKGCRINRITRPHLLLTRSIGLKASQALETKGVERHSRPSTADRAMPFSLLPETMLFPSFIDAVPVKRRRCSVRECRHRVTSPKVVLAAPAWSARMDDYVGLLDRLAQRYRSVSMATAPGRCIPRDMSPHCHQDTNALAETAMIDKHSTDSYRQ